MSFESLIHSFYFELRLKFIKLVLLLIIRYDHIDLLQMIISFLPHKKKKKEKKRKCIIVSLLNYVIINNYYNLRSTSTLGRLKSCVRTLSIYFIHKSHVLIHHLTECYLQWMNLINSWHAFFFYFSLS